MMSSFTDQNTSHFVEITEGELKLRLHYNDAGHGKEAVVLIHGSGPGASGWSNFHRNVQPLVNAGYRVILMDCPGWSQSDPVISRGSRSELNAAALKGLLDVLGIERAHLVGNSMGGHSAVAFALGHPKRVGKLVLMGGGTGGASTFAPMPTEGIKLVQSVYRTPTVENLKALMNVFVYDGSTIDDVLLQSRLASLNARPEHLVNFLESAKLNPKQFPDVSPRLSEITAPALVIWGRDDRFVPLDIGLRLVAGLQNADLIVFSRCGHWAQWEHADKFNRHVIGFLNGG
ncbi:alpha/beta fold hydrolase [Ottowia thiooxydans]|uniref:2-hydroxy-6-oxonona-2,4-dienedioate hydrolase n=1 Tax=Ottowia thiooxydans TaxID=219182 RepID=A0ABV2QG22_9BURK